MYLHIYIYIHIAMPFLRFLGEGLPEDEKTKKRQNWEHCGTLMLLMGGKEPLPHYRGIHTS